MSVLAMLAAGSPVGKRCMDGRRYAYSSCSPYCAAAGTTNVSRDRPCTALTRGFSLLLKSSTAAMQPGRSTLCETTPAQQAARTLTEPSASQCKPSTGWMLAQTAGKAVPVQFLHGAWYVSHIA